HRAAPRRGRRRLPPQRDPPPVQPSRLRRPRAVAPPETAAPARRDPQAGWKDGGEGHDPRPRAAVLQERPREGGGQPGEGQKGLRQARDDQAARSRSRNARGHQGAPVIHCAPSLVAWSLVRRPSLVLRPKSVAWDHGPRTWDGPRTKNEG